MKDSAHQTAVIQQTAKMYRAIRMFNGGEEQQIKHFETLSDAYNWLQPANNVQEIERWHSKLLPVIRQDIEESNFKVVTIGFNELMNSKECSLYIQIVDQWDDQLPRF